jgi:hypothetical protein
MLPFADTESGPDTTNVNYRKAYARYLSLRNSTAQKGEVGQVAKYQGADTANTNRGEHVSREAYYHGD